MCCVDSESKAKDYEKGLNGALQSACLSAASSVLVGAGQTNVLVKCWTRLNTGLIKSKLRQHEEPVASGK
jgi:hypothetical protein